MSAPVTFEQPPLPPTLVRLEDSQSQRLRLFNPNPWRNPIEQCRTCSKENVPAGSEDGAGGIYRWYAGTSRDEADIVLYRCDCRAQFRLYQWMAWAGIGLNYMRTDWFDALDLRDTPAMTAALDYAMNGPYHANAGNNLVLHSPQPGTGKTFLASLMAKRMLWMGLDVYMTTFTGMLDLYTASWRQDDERRFFDERVRGAQVLVVDDVGREPPGRFSVAAPLFEAVLRMRLADCKPTVVTTNLDDDDLNAYGQNTLSLLSERKISVPVIGADKRPLMTARASREHELNLKRPIVIS